MVDCRCLQPCHCVIVPAHQRNRCTCQHLLAWPVQSRVERSCIATPAVSLTGRLSHDTVCCFAAGVLARHGTLTGVVVNRGFEKIRQFKTSHALSCMWLHNRASARYRHGIGFFYFFKSSFNFASSFTLVTEAVLAGLVGPTMRSSRGQFIWLSCGSVGHAGA